MFELIMGTSILLTRAVEVNKFVLNILLKTCLFEPTHVYVSNCCLEHMTNKSL